MSVFEISGESLKLCQFSHRRLSCRGCELNKHNSTRSQEHNPSRKTKLDVNLTRTRLIMKCYPEEDITYLCSNLRTLIRNQMKELYLYVLL